MATPKLILDNRVNVSSDFDQLVKYSGVNVNYFSIQPDGTSFPNQVLYNNIVVPNLSTTLVSRNIRHQYDVVVQYDRTSANKPALAGVSDYSSGQGGADGGAVLGQGALPVDTVLRAPFPLQQTCSSTSLTINSGTNTINSQQVLDPLARRLPRKYLMGDASEAPSMLDNKWLLQSAAGTRVATGNLTVPVGNPAYATWADVVTGGSIPIVIAGQTVDYLPTGAAPPAIGSIIPLNIAAGGYTAYCQCNTVWTAASRTIGVIYLYQSPATNLQSQSCQPLSVYENTADGFSRAAFLPIFVNSNNNTVTVRYNVTEQLFLSPCTLWSNENFLANVNTLSLLFNFANNLTNMFVSANPTCAITSVAIQNPRLSLTYIQINPEVMSIPRSVAYNYENIVYFSKTSTWNAGTNQLVSDTIRLQAMPSAMYVLARIPMSSQTISTTNTFLQLGQGGQSQNMPAGVAINIGNRTGLGASASVATWWRIAKRNGWSASFNEFRQAASALCFSPVEDLGVDPSLDSLPMQTGSINFQVSAYFNDNNVVYAGGASPAEVELLIVAVYAGVATITTDQIMFNLGALSANEVNATLAGSGKEGQTFSSEHVQPTIEGKGLGSQGKYILGKMASKHQRSKLSM